MSDQAAQPSFAIQRIYLKDLSLEMPNAPQVLLEQGQPQVDVQLNLHAEPVVDGIYEVAVTATVTTKVETVTGKVSGAGAPITINEADDLTVGKALDGRREV